MIRLPWWGWLLVIIGAFGTGLLIMYFLLWLYFVRGINW